MSYKKNDRYPEWFKLTVLRYYYEHGCSKKLTLLEFEIAHSHLIYWLSYYGSEEKVLTLLSQYEIDMAKSYPKLPTDAHAAQLEYERLLQELEYERLRSEAFNRMINYAEKEFKIPIRKKAGVK